MHNVLVTGASGFVGRAVCTAIERRGWGVRRASRSGGDGSLAVGEIDGRTDWSGALAGCGGVFLSMGAVSFFLRDMTAGRGYIALAAVFLGGVRPVGAFIAALVFGAAEAAAIQLGAFEIPTQFITALPYAITLIALCLFSSRVRQLQKDWRLRRRAKLV